MNQQMIDQRMASQRANAIREQYREGIKAKGFSFTVPANTTSQQLTLTGQASMFFGLAFFNLGTTGISVGLNINEFLVIENVMAQLLEVDGAANGRAFYEFPRPLNGQDTINLNFQNSTGAPVVVYLIVYYK
jgi:hypothetical protein